MAREYARVKLSIWADDDFRALSAPAQGMYFMLLTSPSLKLCGVADWRPKRIAAQAKGLTVRQVKTTVDELAEHGYVVFDDDQEEILIRSFMRHDGVLRSPNITAAMAKDFAGVNSPEIRRAIVAELVRLREKYPDWAGWRNAEDVLANYRINGSEVVSIRLAEGFDIGSGNHSPIPQPSALSPQPIVKVKREARQRATRLPENWLPSEPVREWAKERFPNLDLRLETEKFVNHFTAKAGKDATKMSWDATWRNWILKAAEWGGQGNPASTPVPWTPPPPPREVADDPEAYDAYMREQYAQHRSGS